MISLVFGTILPWAIAAAGCWLGYLMLRQHGRILLRLESLEQRVQQLAATPRSMPNAPPSLPMGSAAPDFDLPSLTGAHSSLADYRGKRLLLVFFNPRCSYCVRMAPDLAALPVDDADGRPIPLVITTGDVEENRRLVEEHKILAPVLLQRANEVAAAYQAHGTPMGYLIDEQARIASPVAAGAEALLALARDDARKAPSAGERGLANANGQKKSYKGNRSLTDSRINRSGLLAGTPAPVFQLPCVGGGEVSLASYRGRRVLLVFSDPQCSPCNELAPHLEHLHRNRPDLEVVMVSRGNVEENREKAAQLGLTFPVVLQKQWEVSRDYGMFGTPIGYLIDEKGTIAANVAAGVDAILALSVPASSQTQKREGAHSVK